MNAGSVDSREMDPFIANFIIALSNSNYPVEKYMHAVKLMQICEGTDQINRIFTRSALMRG
jgi:hypothetical protein